MDTIMRSLLKLCPPRPCFPLDGLGCGRGDHGRSGQRAVAEVNAQEINRGKEVLDERLEEYRVSEDVEHVMSIVG